ncbi:50S ribosomal protein L23, partial [Candidatus Microgenomates bacterium]
MNLEDVIIKPIISEKSMAHAGAEKFTFMVSKDSDKKSIKKAVEKKFKVNVLSVSTHIVKGKNRRVGARRAEV